MRLDHKRQGKRSRSSRRGQPQDAEVHAMLGMLSASPAELLVD